MPWKARELELEKYTEPRVDKTLCQVKGCSRKRVRTKKGRRYLCAPHLKRLCRRGTLLIKGTTALDSRWKKSKEVRNPYGMDNSTKTEYVAGLIREVDSGNHRR